MNQLSTILLAHGLELRTVETRTTYDVVRDGHNGGTTFARPLRAIRRPVGEMALMRRGAVVCFLSRDPRGEWGALRPADRNIAREPGELVMSGSYAYWHKSLTRVIERMA